MCCVTDPLHSADSTRCDTATYRGGWTVYAVIMIMVYPVGIPCIYFTMLWRKHELLDPFLEGTGKRARDVASIDEASKLREV